MTSTKFLRFIIYGLYIIKLPFIFAIGYMLYITGFGMNTECSYILKDVVVLTSISVVMIYLSIMHDSLSICMYRNNLDLTVTMHVDPNKFMGSPKTLLTNSKIFGINMLTDIVLLIINYIYAYIRVGIIHDNIIYNIIWCIISGIIFTVGMYMLHDILEDKKKAVKQIKELNEYYSRYKSGGGSYNEK